MLCLFVTKKHINFVGDAPSPAHSHEPRPSDTGVTRHRTNVWGGGINKIRPCGGQFHSGHGKKVKYQ